jgi:hypothetical protein
MTREHLKRCPVCGGTPDGYTYERDEGHRGLGYPATFRLCGTCQSPLLGELAQRNELKTTKPTLAREGREERDELFQQ